MAGIETPRFKAQGLKLLLDLTRRFAAKGREDPERERQRQENYARKVWAGEYVDFSLVKAIVASLGLNNYAVIGGQAAILYGSPRVTADVDILSTKDQVEAVIKHFTPPPRPMTIGGYTVKLHGVDVDLLHWNDEPWLTELLAAAVEHQGIRVVSKPWLLLLKLRASRYLDLVDSIPLAKAMSPQEIAVARELILKYTPNEVDDFESLVQMSDLIGPDDLRPEKQS